LAKWTAVSGPRLHVISGFGSFGRESENHKLVTCVEHTSIFNNSVSLINPNKNYLIMTNVEIHHYTITQPSEPASASWPAFFH
jgi:hypothetical protein